MATGALIYGIKNKILNNAVKMSTHPFNYIEKKNLDTHQAKMFKTNVQKSGNICTFCKNISLQNRDKSPWLPMFWTGKAAAGQTNTADTSDANIVNDSVMKFADINNLGDIQKV